MKQLLLTGLLIAFSGLVRAADIVDGVAAVVNEKVITYSDVRDFVQPVVAQLRRDYSGDDLIEKVRAAQLDALNSLIDRALIVQEFTTKGYNIPQHVIEQQFKDTIADQFNNDRTAFLKTLEAQHMTVSQYRDQLRDRIIVQAMRNRKTQQEIAVSPYKIEKYYQDHQDDFKVSDQIKLRLIFIKRSPAPAPPAAGSDGQSEPAPAPPADSARVLAEEILAKLDAKDSFQELAKLYSQGKEASTGGDRGWVDRESLRKELNEIAFKLKPNEHSGIIETPEGYYLLQVEDVKAAHVKLLPEVRDEIEKNLLQEQRAKMQVEWVKELRVKAYIRMF